MLFSFQVHMLDVKNAYSPGLVTWVLVSNLLLTKPVTLGKSLLSRSPALPSLFAKRRRLLWFLKAPFQA